jgi:hypothetical protein
LQLTLANYKGRFRYLSIRSVAKAAAHLAARVKCFYIKKDPYTISDIEIFVCHLNLMTLRLRPALFTRLKMHAVRTDGVKKKTKTFF